MLNQKQISQLAVKWQTSELNVLREFIQHRFLSCFYQKRQSQNILFKGGTALRLIFNSPRFSEDLDFSASKVTIRHIEDIITGTLSDLEKESIPAELTEAKTTSGGYLSSVNFKINQRAIPLTLEISQRKSGIKGQLVYVNPELCPPYSIWHLALEQLVSEKIQAAITRQKPRDFFDIYYLLRSRMIKPEQKPLLKQIPKALSASRINFSHELKQFLPVSLHAVIKNFHSILTRELERN